MEEKRKPGKFKNKFTPAEDQLLLEVVDRLGCKDWSEVASHLQGRNARQCRERWNNYVNPAIAKLPWTPAEDRLLEQKFREFGTKWHSIASFFPNRSKNSIKNHWMTHQKKMSRCIPKIPDVIIERDKDKPFGKIEVTPIPIISIGAFEEMFSMPCFRDEGVWSDLNSDFLLN